MFFDQGDKMSEHTLLPCPFCGGEAGLRNTLAERKASSPTSAYVMCKSCLASTSSFEGSTCVSKAISAWNRRTPPAVPEGWVLVPKEPTPEMLFAATSPESYWIGHPEAPPESIERWRQCHREDAARKYRSMISAAPAAPADRLRRTPPAAVPDAWSKLLLAAKILYHNAEVCVANHHGRDFKAFGLPGWLADCKRDIENAEASLAGISAAPTPPVDERP